MKLYFLCANDKIFLPPFLNKVFKESRYETVGVAIVNNPKFRQFLKESLAFMGIRLFLAEVIHQISVRLKNIFYHISKSSRITSIEEVCSRYGVEVVKIDRVNSDSFRAFLRQKDIDVLISIACPQVLRKKVLSIPHKAAINIHYALLPFYRGQYPSFWVLTRGEEFTGVSVHHMVQELDAGDIIIQLKERIRSDDSFYSLVARLKTTIGPKALLMALDKLFNGDESVIENEIEKGSYFSFPTKADMAEFLQRGRRWR